MAGAPRELGPWELLRGNRSYRRLFGARLISFLGDWFNTLAALALLRELGAGEAGAFGWVLILKTLPAVAVSPLAGVLADRLPGRALLIAVDLLRAAVVLAMLSLARWPEPGLLYALIIAQSAASAFFDPARNALLPRLVPPEGLTAANALGGAAWSLMLVVGAGLGGLVTSIWGWELALGVDAATYLASAALLLGVAEPPRARQRPLPGWRRWTGWQDLAEGAAYLASAPRALTLALVKAGWEVSGAILLVLTLLGEQRHTLGGRAMAGVAALYVARGLGTGVGPFLARWWSRGDAAAMERAIGWSFAAGAVFYLALAEVEAAPLAWACVTLAHLGGATMWVFSTVRLQQAVPPALQGRVFAAEQAAYTVTLAASTWAYGHALDAGWLDLDGALRGIGLGIGLAWAAWTLRGRRLGWGRDD